MTVRSENGRVLVVDDEENMRTVLKTILSREGFDVHTAGNGLEALQAAERHGPFQAVLTDLKMPGMDGMTLLEVLGQRHPETSVVILTAHGSVDSAVQAVKAGAFDYLEKPFDREQIRLVIRKAVHTARLKERHARPVEAGSKGRFGLVGTSAPMLELYRIIEKVADTPSTVLITGESGTGKELVARAIHNLSSRRDRPFVAINCAAIPSELMESELFGYEKGAFTGAVSSKPGRFELAHGGTLFLDEVAEIPLPMQVKLLRILQTNEFERVGGLKTIRVDVRLVAATNRDLKRDVASGRFREDLFYRLNVVPIRTTPLRERLGDLELLVEHFVVRFNERLNRRILGFSKEAIERLKQYPWPGNVRELENVVERTMLFVEGPVIQPQDLPDPFAHQADLTQAEPAQGPLPQGDLKTVVRTEAQKVARKMILQALQRTHGNVTQAAKLLGLSRKGLQLKMKELGLRPKEPAHHESPAR